MTSYGMKVLQLAAANGFPLGYARWSEGESCKLRQSLRGHDFARKRIRKTRIVLSSDA